jgi:glycosyltransferase involved in cell wall biosynthesis
MTKVLMLANDNYVVDRRIIQQAQALAAEGYSVEVICGFEVAEEVVETHGDVRVHRFATQKTGGGAAVKIIKAFNRLSGRNTAFESQVLSKVVNFDFQILHVHDMPLLRVGTQIARERGCQLVYDAHELYFAQASIPWPTRLRMKWEESKYIQLPNLVLTVNPFVADEMKRLYGRKDIHVLLNSALTVNALAPTAPPSLRELAGIGADQKVVLYQGWISPERGLGFLISAASHWRNLATLIVIGYGDHVQTLREQVNLLGLEGTVKFLGRTGYEELRRLTPQADVGVIPYVPCDFNTKYCSPNKFFEYIASGVPVVSNDLPFLRAEIEKYKCGRVANIEEGRKFAEAVIEQLKDGDARNNCANAQRELGWDVEKKKLVSWYEALA